MMGRDGHDHQKKAGAIQYRHAGDTGAGGGGAIWLLAAGGMLCTKKYRRQGVILLAGLAVGVLVGNVCLGAWLVFAAVRRLTRRSRP